MPMSYEIEIPRRKIGMIIAGVILVAVIALLLSSSIKIVESGHRGVLLHWSEVDGVSFQNNEWVATRAPLNEGLHFVVPIQDDIVPIEVRTTKFEKSTTSASNDLQTVSTTVTVNYHLDPERVHVLYRSLGLDFSSRIIQPAVDETVKQVTANYDAEELITKRAIVKSDIETALEKRLTPFGIIQETVSLTDFQFSAVFDAAVEAKVEAQQKALQAENDLRRIQVEAQQTEAIAIGQANANIAKAKGEAEAISVINKALLQSPEYMEWLKTQKWNGELPRVTGGAVPFVEIPMEGVQP